MRITGGRARGIPIKAPRGNAVRPATDYLRQAVFSSLGKEIIEDARVLDVFAGTGAYGLEALSRGAAHVTFVEKERAASTGLSANLTAVAKAIGHLENDIATLTKGDFFSVIHRESAREPFGLIFVDPPYALWETRGAEILNASASALRDDGVIILEAPGSFDPPIPDGFGLRRRLSKGARQPSVAILERVG